MVWRPIRTPCIVAKGDLLYQRAIGRVHDVDVVVARAVAVEGDFVSGFTRAGFEGAVDRIKDYIVEGDAMQVVLSQRMSIPFSASPLNLYRALRRLNPSPYMYYLHLGDVHIVGASPELLVQVEDGIVSNHPIAGTRPRGQDTAEDKALEEDLKQDEKEIAEHIMLVDLARNDVGMLPASETR